MCRFLIVADGEFQTKSWIELAATERSIVALDGACAHLKDMNIDPDIILGDMDGLANEDQFNYWGIDVSQTEPYAGKHGVLVVPTQQQKYTDLYKGIEYLDGLGATDIAIICALGGRVDHSLMNIRLLRHFHKESRSLCIHTQSQTLIFVRDKSVVFHGKKEDYCGVMAFPNDAIITTKNLKYPCDHSKIQFAKSDSACNQMLGKEAEISVEGEALLILPSQKNIDSIQYGGHL